jgi:hypothetical protein
MGSHSFGAQEHHAKGMADPRIGQPPIEVAFEPLTPEAMFLAAPLERAQPEVPDGEVKGPCWLQIPSARGKVWGNTLQAARR